jgi:hypothetical protein
MLSSAFTPRPKCRQLVAQRGERNEVRNEQQCPQSNDVPNARSEHHQHEAYST